MSLESSQLFISEANWWTSSVTEVDYMYTPQPFREAILSLSSMQLSYSLTNLEMMSSCTCKHKTLTNLYMYKPVLVITLKVFS